MFDIFVVKCGHQLSQDTKLILFLSRRKWFRLENVKKKNMEKYEFYKKMNGSDVNGIINDNRLLFLSQDVIQSNLE